MAEGEQAQGEKDKKEVRLESLKRDLADIIPGAQGTDSEEEEKLEFLKREEIKTMQKDVKRLREIEARKEKERIASLAREKEEKKKQPAKKPPQPIKISIEKEEPRAEPEKEEETPAETVLMPKAPAHRQRGGLFKKIAVRVFFVLIFVGLIGGAYYLFRSGALTNLFPQKTAPETTQEEETTPPGTQEEEEEEFQIEVPISFVPVEKTFVVDIADNSEIPQEIKRIAGDNLPQGEFSRIVLENKGKKRLVSLDEIAQAFQVSTVPEVINKIDIDRFTFLLYPQPEGMRQALIARIEDEEGFSEGLKTWENKLVQQGISGLGQQIPALGTSFKNYSFQNVPFRYLTIGKDDSGICYAVYKGYLVITSSFKAMNQAIVKLKPMQPETISAELYNNLGQLFIVGFDGTTVTPQLENFLTTYRPGGVLLLSKNIENAEQLSSLIQNLQDVSVRETGLPLFIAVDQEGGEISRIGFLEEKTPQSEIAYTDEAYNIGLNRGEELKQLGVNLNLAPLLDDMQGGDFYYARTFQKSPDLTGDLAKYLIDGQKAAGILTAVKHFPGYVGESLNPESSLLSLEVPEISQFQRAIQAEPEFVMIANAVYPEIDDSLPLTFSPLGISYLKDNLGSSALIISDDLAQSSLLDKFSLQDIVTRPIAAGVDVLIFSGWRFPVTQGMDAFFEAANSGKISDTKLQEEVSKIISLKQNLLQ